LQAQAQSCGFSQCHHRHCSSAIDPIAFGYGESSMNLPQIRSIATSKGIKPGKRNKVELVRSIQRQEGAFDCFATAYEGVCDQNDCLWRDDCFSYAKKALAS
jgi:hypothetical protein